MKYSVLIVGLLLLLVIGSAGGASSPVFARLTLNESITARHMTVGTFDTIDLMNLSQTMVTLESTTGDDTDVKVIAHPAFRNVRRVFTNTSISQAGNTLTILGPADSTVSWTGLPEYKVYTQRLVPTVHTFIPGEEGNIILAKANTTVAQPNLAVIFNSTDVIYLYTSHNTQQGIVALFPASGTIVTSGVISSTDFDVNNLTYTLNHNRVQLDDFLVNRQFAEDLSFGARPVPGLYMLEVFSYDPSTSTILNLASVPVVVMDGDNPISLAGFNPPYLYNKTSGTGIDLTFDQPAGITNVSYLLIKDGEQYDIRMDVDLLAFAQNANNRWTTMQASGFPLATIAEQAVIGDIGAGNGINYTITRVGSPSPQPPVNWYTIAISPGYGISGRGVNSPGAFIPPGDLNTLVPGDYFLYATGLSAINDVVSLDQQMITITGEQAPVANFTADPTSGVAPLFVQFTDQSTGSITAWAWDFTNDGSIDSTQKNPNFTYPTPGTYSVRLNVTGPGGSSSKLRTGYITVTAAPVPPVANFTADPTSGVAPLFVQFTDQSTGSITAWAWDFTNDGSIDSTQKNPNFTYPTPGTYSVRLNVTGPGGSSSKLRTGYITVTAAPVPPVANFTADPTSGVAPLFVQFTDQSTGSITAWAWDFTNDGSIDSTQKNPNFTYPTPGTYSVRLNVTGPGGSSSKLRTGYITVTAAPVPPVANFTADPTSGVAPLFVQFTDQSTGSITAWAWDFTNDGSIDSTQKNPNFTYPTPGTYSVRLNVTGPGGSSSKLRTGYITVSPVPEGAVILGWVGSGSDYIPGIRIRVARNASDLANPALIWENTTNTRGIYIITGLPAGVPLYAQALSPVSQPAAYLEQPVQYQINRGRLVTNTTGIIGIPPVYSVNATQVNWILTPRPPRFFYFF